MSHTQFFSHTILMVPPKVETGKKSKEGKLSWAFRLSVDKQEVERSLISKRTFASPFASWHPWVEYLLRVFSFLSRYRSCTEKDTLHQEGHSC